MWRPKVLLVATSALVVLIMVGVCFGTTRITNAMQYSDPDTAMTKSVARITFTGTYKGQTINHAEICTGSVVGDGWVLSALHCYYPAGIGATPLDWHGLHVQLWQAGMNISTRYESALSGPPLWMSGGDHLSGDVLYRDVMLLHVVSAMPSWAKTIPMALRWPGLGTTLTEYGYGRTSSSGSVSTALMKSHQGSITRAACPSGHAWTSGNLCTNTTSSLPWNGDSGGPLLWWNNGYWQQVGIFSQYPDPTKNPGQTWRSFWSEADGSTRSWVVSAVGASAPVWAILRDPATGASWQYQEDGYRHWIHDGGTYNCLVSAGVPVLNRPLRTIEALPDKVGNWASCLTEQEGSYGANSFANPHNASGMGPHLGAMAYVQVSCKVYAPEIASVNPDGYWYRIASTPFGYNYYIAANTFWNGDIPGHYPYTHNTDWNVPNC